MIKKRISSLLTVKSIITITMTVVLAVLLFGEINPPQELLTLYCSSYAMVLAFYFSRVKEEKDDGKEN